MSIYANLTSIQNNIARLYETPVNFSIEDFLITDLAALGLRQQISSVKTAETLYLLETDDGINISLYLDQGIVDSLNESVASDQWKFTDVKEYLLALEGVSHFQYLIWNAERDKSVTLFELELQAEVDKYVMASVALADRREGHIPKDLYGYLFDSISYRNELSPEVARRYREANHYAGKYCRSLKSQYPNQHQQIDFLTELRQFYRLPCNEKVRRIEHR
ncbi:MAG: hypothetical protein AAF387_15080 [Pseudomonadota bacterium]